MKFHDRRTSPFVNGDDTPEAICPYMNGTNPIYHQTKCIHLSSQADYTFQYLFVLNMHVMFATGRFNKLQTTRTIQSYANYVLVLRYSPICCYYNLN